MGESRRRFLKIIALAPIAAALPQFILVEEDVKLLDGQQWIANVRELTQVDMWTTDVPHWVVRFDILLRNPKTKMVEQIGVDATMKDPSELPRVREPCAAALQRYMTERGWRVADMLPFDHGFKIGQSIY